MEIKVLKNKQNLKLKQARLAIIDIGSNSIRMLIYDDFSSSRVPFFNEKAVCELGKNLDKSKKLHKSGVASPFIRLLAKWASQLTLFSFDSSFVLLCSL